MLLLPAGAPASSKVEALLISIDDFTAPVGRGDLHLGQVPLRTESQRNPTTVVRLPATAFSAFGRYETPLDVVGFVFAHGVILAQVVPRPISQNRESFSCLSAPTGSSETSRSRDAHVVSAHEEDRSDPRDRRGWFCGRSLCASSDG